MTRLRRTARARRRHAALLVLLAMLFGIFVLVPSATAVHDLDLIELHTVNGGDTEANIANDPDVDDETDWGESATGANDGIFNTHNGSGCVGEINNPGGDPVEGQIDSTFICDFEPGANGPDPSFHEPSNKDQMAINPVGGSGVWGCVSKPNPLDKDDIVNAYAVAVRPTSGPETGDLIVYFGVERHDNSGTAFIGIWLFQEDVGCDPALGKFTGKKTTGDILLLANFTNGGSFISLEAYRWIAGPTLSSPGTFSLLSDEGVDCDTSGLSSDDFCANVNTTNVLTPWPMEDKEKPGAPNPDPANTLEISEFLEGGINITDVFAGAGQTAPVCFGSYMAETRTAAQLEGANLADIALGDLKTCSGAVAITKNSPKGPVEGVTFTITGAGLPAAGVPGVTNADGVVCFGGLDLDVTYTVTETVPTGMRVDGDNPQAILVDQAGTCTDGNAETLSFGNIPLADIRVQFRDGGSGLTQLDSAGITCDNATGTDSTPTETGWDNTLLIEDIDIDVATVTINCTIPIDP